MRGPGGEPSWAETRSGGTEVSHLGEGPELPPGVRPIFLTRGKLKNQEREPSWGKPGQVGPRVATLDRVRICLQG